MKIKEISQNSQWRRPLGATINELKSKRGFVSMEPISVGWSWRRFLNPCIPPRCIFTSLTKTAMFPCSNVGALRRSQLLNQPQLSISSNLGEAEDWLTQPCWLCCYRVIHGSGVKQLPTFLKLWYSGSLLERPRESINGLLSALYARISKPLSFAVEGPPADASPKYQQSNIASLKKIASPVVIRAPQSIH